MTRERERDMKRVVPLCDCSTIRKMWFFQTVKYRASTVNACSKCFIVLCACYIFQTLFHFLEGKLGLWYPYDLGVCPCVCMYYMFRPIVAIIRYIELLQSFFLFVIPSFTGQCLHIRNTLYRCVGYVIPLCNGNVLNIKIFQLELKFKVGVTGHYPLYYMNI
jgi:hypothetical protein